MAANLPPMDESAESKLTKLVYALVMEPERLYLMRQLLDESVSPVFDQADGGSAAPFFDNLQIHFDNAFEMLQRRETNDPNRSIAHKLVDIDAQPSILLNSDGVILRANNAAVEEMNASEGAKLDISLIQNDDQLAFQTALEAIGNDTKDRLIGVFDMASLGNEPSGKMIMSKVAGTDGQAIAHLANFKMRWQPHTGENFSKAFKLTPDEQAIIQALVEGNSLTSVAQAHGSAPEAARDQLNLMMAKLGLKSQTELICLYAGFAQISILPSGLTAPNLDPIQEENYARIFERANGTPLEVEFYGPENGTPVLFFHPFMGGTLLSEQQKSLINAQNLRFIMPLQPGIKGTLDAGTQGDRLGDYSRDLASILQQLNIKSCPAVCVNMSLVYALAFAHHAPGVLNQIVTSNAAVPLKTAHQFKQVSIQQRIPYLVSKYVPSLLNFYVRSVQAELDAGYEKDYIDNYYESSPIDLKTILEPEILGLFRRATMRIFENGHEAAVQHLRMEVSDWTHYLEQTTLPITLLNGDKDTEFGHSMVKQSVAKYENIRCVEIPNSGALMWHQKPAEVLSYLQK